MSTPEEHPEVEQLLGICAVLDAAQAAELPHLDGIDFEADREIWVDIIRDKWEKLDDTARRMVLAQARTSEAEVSPSAAGGELAATLEDDTKAAKSLEEILDQLDECEYVTLSLFQWRARRDELLADDKAATTVLLFDRDFHREENGAEDEGFKLIREAQVANVGYCGLNQPHGSSGKRARCLDQTGHRTQSGSRQVRRHRQGATDRRIARLLPVPLHAALRGTERTICGCQVGGMVRLRVVRF